MPQIINTNVASLNSQRNLNVSQSAHAMTPPAWRSSSASPRRSAA
jgi:hypothetical protein